MKRCVPDKGCPHRDKASRPDTGERGGTFLILPLPADLQFLAVLAGVARRATDHDRGALPNDESSTTTGLIRHYSRLVCPINGHLLLGAWENRVSETDPNPHLRAAWGGP